MTWGPASPGPQRALSIKRAKLGGKSELQTLQISQDDTSTHILI